MSLQAQCNTTRCLKGLYRVFVTHFILLTNSSSNFSSVEDFCKPEYLTPTEQARLFNDTKCEGEGLCSLTEIFKNVIGQYFFSGSQEATGNSINQLRKSGAFISWDGTLGPQSYCSKFSNWTPTLKGLTDNYNRHRNSKTSVILNINSFVKSHIFCPLNVTELP